MRYSRTLLGLAAVCCLVGCGPREVTIEGTVTLDDEPLPKTQVLFDQPDAEAGNSFSGRTDADGHFRLKLLGEELNTPVAGTYRVSLTTSVPDRDATESTPPPKELIPKQYRNGALDFELPEDGTLEADFALESKQKR